MKVRLLPIILLFLFSFSFYPVLAQTDTEDTLPTPKPQVLSESENNTIEDVRKAVSEKVKEKLAQITDPDADTKKAWVGTITRTDPTQIIIDHKGSSKTINISKDTTIVGLNRQKMDPATLKEGTTLLAMGYTTSTNTLDGKRLVVTDPKTLIRQQIVTGKIVDVSQSSPIFVVIPNTNKNLQYQIKTDTKTIVKDKSGATQKTSALENGKKVAVIITPDAKTSNTYLASRIILLDSPQPKTSPSPSPSDSTTSQKVTPSVKNTPRQ